MSNITVIKRDGRKVNFNEAYIEKAVKGAFVEVNSILQVEEFVEACELSCEAITSFAKNNNYIISVENIQDIVVGVLLKINKSVGEAYNRYREDRTRIREANSSLMKKIGAVGVQTDRDNANVGNNFSSKLLRIASESNKTYNLHQMPRKLARKHEEGDFHFHDLDSYNLTTNCLHVPTRDILVKGFNTGYGTIKPPKRIESAGELSCILLQASQNDMFGGQSHPNFDNDMAVFVEPTRQEIKKEMKDLGLDNITSLVEAKLETRIRQAMQGVIYNLNTMHSRAGSQVPFSSVNIGIPENEDSALVCKCFLEEYKKGLGNGEQPIFPNIIFRVKEGVNREKEDPYYYLFELACEVASKRMNPTFMNMDASFNKVWYDQGILPATMG